MTTVPQDPKQLRHFGLIVGGIFAAIGLWPAVVRGQSPRWWAVALGVALVLPALLLPGSLRPAYRVWMALGDVLGWINTRIILGAIFYGMLTPIGVCLRLRGRDPLRRGIDPRLHTYRVVRQPRPASHMTRQF
jgi:hypothetical protein